MAPLTSGEQPSNKAIKFCKYCTNRWNIGAELSRAAQEAESSDESTEESDDDIDIGEEVKITDSGVDSEQTSISNNSVPDQGTNINLLHQDVLLPLQSLRLEAKKSKDGDSPF